MAKKTRATVRPSGSVDPAVSGTLRIIGGTLRGRPIVYTGDPRTRPMKQRVREAVFNLVGRRVVGTHALDLFAGTGALAWEALSRGAVRATLIERHFPTVRVIRQNAAALGLTDRVSVVAGDSFVWARQLAATPPLSAPAPPWLVFCAPPYRLYSEQAADLAALLTELAARAPAHSVLVVEADQRLDPATLPQAFQWQVRAYSPAIIAIGTRQDAALDTASSPPAQPPPANPEPG